MAIYNKDLFQNPEFKFRLKPMMHALSSKEDPAIFVEALKYFGYGGAVINPAGNDNGEVYAEDEAIDAFASVAKALKENGMDYWIYDEHGYPSGHAGGLSLKGHPELESKGVYMVRRIAYEPRHTTFTIDDETDKIVWAAKYPVEVVNVSQSYVQYHKMIPVPFTDTFCECNLEENEAFYIFCMKPAYEGSHLTHNVSSHRRYINIMDKRAVKRFIDVAYNPIAERAPEVYKNAEAVFTDEPSLQSDYVAGYETWPYALIPWVEGLPEMFEQEYGHSLLPVLPRLFEATEKSYPTRVKFYRLVGKLIAEAFSGQLSEWCHAHGTKFSGHYLSEEVILSQVRGYGDHTRVVLGADYPGLDILQCTPEKYNCNTSKSIQMIARKKGTKGSMVELCPFTENKLFEEDPWNNMSCIVGMLAQSGARRFNSYFFVDFSQYDNRFRERGEKLDFDKNSDRKNECRLLNEYVGRIGYMLDGLWNDCSTYIYRAVEATQAKYFPLTTAQVTHPAISTDSATGVFAKTDLFLSGHDFEYIDVDDLLEAEKSLENGDATLAGSKIKTIIVPGAEVIDERSVEALKKLQNSGVHVFFMDSLPYLGALTCENLDLSSDFKVYNRAQILEHLDNTDTDLSVKCDGVTLLKTKYIKNGKELYFICNNTRSKDAELVLNHKKHSSATLYNPIDGSITPIKNGEKYTVPSFRGIFLLFD